jgi:acylphosphatase
MKHINIIVFGHVQGVGFRNSAAHQARYLGISGYVKNLPDGCVYIEAEGDTTAISEFIKWCRKGPGYGRVENITTEESPLKFFTGFEVKY